MNTDLQQLLIDNGYKYHRSDVHKLLKSTEHLYQKRVLSEDGHTKYFIDVWYYPSSKVGGHSLCEGIEVECTLYSGPSNPIVNVSPYMDYRYDSGTHSREYSQESVDKMEKMIDDMWKFTGGGHYE